MKKSKKGFTLLELMLVLALIVVVLGIIYPFFTSNNRTLNETTVKSELQQEGAQIIESITKNLMEANRIESITSVDGTNSLYVNICTINNFTLRLEKEDGTSYYIGYVVNNEKFQEHDSRTGNTKELSTNIHDVKVESIDGTAFSTAKGIKLTLTFSKKAGGRDIQYSISTNIRFRNYGVNING